MNYAKQIDDRQYLVLNEQGLKELREVYTVGGTFSISFDYSAVKTFPSFVQVFVEHTADNGEEEAHSYYTVEPINIDEIIMDLQNKLEIIKCLKKENQI